MATRKKTTPTPTPEPEAPAVPTQPEVEAPAPAPRLTPAELRDRRTGLDLSRQLLATFAGISPSRVWAAEQEPPKDVSDEHYQAIVTALDRLAALPLAERNPAKAAKTKSAASPSKTELAARLATVRGILEEASSLKTNAQLRACLDMALAAATGTPDPTTEDDPADPTDGNSDESTSDEPAEPAGPTPDAEPAGSVVDATAQLVAA